MLAPIQYLLLVRLLANAWRVTRAFQLSQRVRTHLCRVFVIAPRTLASALRLVQQQGTETRLWETFMQRCAQGCGRRPLRSLGSLELLIDSESVFSLALYCVDFHRYAEKEALASALKSCGAVDSKNSSKSRAKRATGQSGG